jgi:hypothetical protein
MKPDQLDQRHDLGLRATEPDGAATDSQASSQNRQVDHQRRVCECQLGEVDQHIGLSANRPGERAATNALGDPILVAAAAERGGLFIESDDCRNLPKRTVQAQVGESAITQVVTARLHWSAW